MSVEQAIEQCITKLEEGRLAVEDLREVAAMLKPVTHPVQDILYLQCSGTGLTSPVVGMSMIRNAEPPQQRVPYEEWPYRTVLDAIREGWRVVQFPNLALMLDESRTYGLGCEFILERWGTNP